MSIKLNDRLVSPRRFEQMDLEEKNIEYERLLDFKDEMGLDGMSHSTAGLSDQTLLVLYANQYQLINQIMRERDQSHNLSHMHQKLDDLVGISAETSEMVKESRGVLAEISGGISSIRDALRGAVSTIMEIGRDVSIMRRDVTSIKQDMSDFSVRLDDMSANVKALNADFTETMRERGISLQELKEPLSNFTLGYVRARAELNQMLAGESGYLFKKEIDTILERDAFRSMMVKAQDTRLQTDISKSIIAIRNAIKAELKGDQHRRLTAHEVKAVVDKVHLEHVSDERQGLMKQYAAQHIHQHQERELAEAIKASTTKEVSAVKAVIAEQQQGMIDDKNLLKRVAGYADRGISGGINLNDGLRSLVRSETIIGAIMNVANSKKDDMIKQYLGQGVLTAYQEMESREKVLEELAHHGAPGDIVKAQKEILMTGMSTTLSGDRYSFVDEAVSRAEKTLEATVFEQSVTSQEMEDAMTVMMKASYLGHEGAKQYLNGERGDVYVAEVDHQIVELLKNNHSIADDIKNERSLKTMKYPLENRPGMGWS